MNLDELVKVTCDLIDTNYKAVNDFKTQQAIYTGLVDSGQMWDKEAKQKIDDIKKTQRDTLAQIRKLIDENTSIVKNEELEKIKNSYEKITPEDYAELKMYSETYVTVDGLNDYAEKYKNKPLALEFLRKIADDNKTMVIIPQTKESILNKLLEDIQIYSGVYENPIYTEYDPVLQMKVNGAKNELNNKLNQYLQYK